MAGETANIATMAKLISAEIFEEFGWNTCGPYDDNWPCIYDDHEKYTHPTDVVFWYPHPYANKNVYVNCDLKSYKAQSITPTSISIALSSLIKATECAQVSDVWHKLYTLENHNRDIVSMLFIYNHDGAYDKNFNNHLDSFFSKDNFKMRKGCKVYIFNPETICYLKTITNDLKTLRGDKVLMDKGTYSFFYPDIHFNKLASDENQVATIETLLGPWQIIKYAKNNKSYGLIVYMRTLGATIEEFVYFIDYLFRYQLIHIVDDITIRIPYADNMAASNLEKAKYNYTFARGEDIDFNKRLAKIKFTQLTNVFTQYSTIEIGMRDVL
jgi:hypothetical protein